VALQLSDLKLLNVWVIMRMHNANAAYHFFLMERLEGNELKVYLLEQRSITSKRYLIIRHLATALLKFCACNGGYRYFLTIFIVLRSESPSNKRPKLHTVAASNSRDHSTINSRWHHYQVAYNQLSTSFTSNIIGHSPRSLYYCLFWCYS